ncbi:unnamed protein product [Peronospora effusa]|nr:unnamed protein product [Peronospora effusa]
MVIAKGSPSQTGFHLKLEANVLVAKLCSPRLQKKTFSDIVMNAVVEQPLASDHQESTLMDFHIRFGHLSFDTIERMVREPESGIKLMNLRRVHCQICAEGKATKSRQPQRDSGSNSPIDRVGGVICSDLKGPITPLDRHGNRYMVNFVDHKTNYVRVFAG